MEKVAACTNCDNDSTYKWDNMYDDKVQGVERVKIAAQRVRVKRKNEPHGQQKYKTDQIHDRPYKEELAAAAYGGNPVVVFPYAADCIFTL